MSTFERVFITVGGIGLIVFYVFFFSKVSECTSNGQEAVRTYNHILPVCMDRK